ncbi:MAG: alpha/beta fold hydrolase [Alphaproteobacteria bacterium]|nr:alpha/beta fold hydrolase [Alphaproteobacteria bacterium]
MKNNKKIDSFRGSLVMPGGRVGVLLLHSLGGTPIELRFVAQGLARNGYTVYCPLLPGFAGGTDVSGLSSWQDWYEALKSAHDELCKHCDVVLVGGLSAGSILTLKLAQERPETVQGLVLYAPTMWPNGWAIPLSFNLFKLIRHKAVAKLFYLRQRAPYGIKDERIRNFLIDSLKGDETPIADLFGRNGGVVWEFRRLVKSVKKGLNEIRQPTVIFHPRTDDQSDISNANILMRLLAGLVEVTVLDDSYHMVTLDRQRSIVVDRTIDFVGRLTQRIEEKEAVRRMVSGAAE